MGDAVDGPWSRVDGQESKVHGRMRTVTLAMSFRRREATEKSVCRGKHGVLPLQFRFSIFMLSFVFLRALRGYKNRQQCSGSDALFRLLTPEF